MAKMTVVGMERTIKQLKDLGRSTVGVCKMGVYDGAAVLVKAMAAAVDALPVDNRKGSESQKLNGLASKQKAGLKEGLGIAKIKSEGGVVNTRVGFDGYNSLHTKKYPNGQPNPLIARAVESGTSFRKATHFASKAIKAATAECQTAMQKTVENQIQKMMEG